MYSRIYTIKFPSIVEAKIGATFLSEEIGSSIAKYDISSLNILLAKDGLLSITLRFDQITDLNKFIKDKAPVFEDLRRSFLVKFNESTAVSVYSFEREATLIH